MFKSIELLKFDDQNTNFHIYNIIDTEFECKIFDPVMKDVVNWAVAVNAVISEYERRGYSHKVIVYASFKYILFLSNKYHFSSFEECLEWQNTYLLRFFKNSNLNDKYYNDLKDMWDNHKAFM